MKKDGKKRSAWIIIVLILVVIAAAAVMWLRGSDNIPSIQSTAEPTAAPTAEPTVVPTNEPTPVPTAEPTPEPTEAPLEVVKAEDGLYVNMRYVTFVYPEEYTDRIDVVLSDMDDGSKMTVSAEFGGKDLELYSLVLSKTQVDGFRLGALKHESAGEIGIYMLMNEQSADHWTEDEFSEISALQESANMILMQLYENENYVSEN